MFMRISAKISLTDVPATQFIIPLKGRLLLMFEQLKTILIDEMQIEEDKIALEAELVNDLGFNSLELAELVIHCEETFDVEVDEEIAKDFVTVSDVVGYLEKLTA